MDFSRAQTAAIQYGPSPPGTEYFFNLKQLASTAFGLDHVVRYSLPEKPKQEQREAQTPAPLKAFFRSVRLAG